MLFIRYTSSFSPRNVCFFPNILVPQSRKEHRGIIWCKYLVTRVEFYHLKLRWFSRTTDGGGAQVCDDAQESELVRATRSRLPSRNNTAYTARESVHRRIWAKCGWDSANDWLRIAWIKRSATAPPYNTRITKRFCRSRRAASVLLPWIVTSRCIEQHDGTNIVQDVTTPVRGHGRTLVPLACNFERRSRPGFWLIPVKKSGFLGRVMTRHSDFRIIRWWCVS